MFDLGRYKVHFNRWDGNELVECYSYESKQGVQKLFKRGTLITKIFDTTNNEVVYDNKHD